RRFDQKLKAERRVEVFGEEKIIGGQDRHGLLHHVLLTPRILARCKISRMRGLLLLLFAAGALAQSAPISVDDPSDARVRLRAGEVAIEYVAHSCFRIHTAGGARLLIDPSASRVWLGYDFPARLAADTVLITHPHYDHDADVLLGQQ